MNSTESGTPGERLEFEAIRALHDRPSLTQRQLASTLGVSLGRAHYCLRALIDKGLLKARNYKKSHHKIGYLYVLTPRGITAKAELTRHFLARKMAEFDALRVEIARLQAESERVDVGR